MDNTLRIPKKIKTGVLIFGIKATILYQILGVGAILFILVAFLSGFNFNLTLYIIPAIITLICFIHPNGLIYPFIIAKAFIAYYRKNNKIFYQPEQSVKYDKVVTTSNYKYGIKKPTYIYDKKMKQYYIKEYIKADVYDFSGHRLIKNIELNAPEFKVIKQKKVLFMLPTIPFSINEEEIAEPLNIQIKGTYLKDKNKE